MPLRRVPLPLMLRPMWMYWKDYETVMASQHLCVDGEMGSVLKLYREVMKQVMPHVTNTWMCASMALQGFEMVPN